MLYASVSQFICESQIIVDRRKHRTNWALPKVFYFSKSAGDKILSETGKAVWSICLFKKKKKKKKTLVVVAAFKRRKRYTRSARNDILRGDEE